MVYIDTLWVISRIHLCSSIVFVVPLFAIFVTILILSKLILPYLTIFRLLLRSFVNLTNTSIKSANHSRANHIDCHLVNINIKHHMSIMSTVGTLCLLK